MTSCVLLKLWFSQYTLCRVSDNQGSKMNSVLPITENKNKTVNNFNLS